jgi:Na+-driven multidrug efflux pump
MIVIGLNQGMQPIAGYNFGAKQYSRVTEVLKKTVVWATLVMSAGFLVGELFPHAVCSLFTKDEALVNMAALGMRIVFLIYPLVGFQVVVSNFFQSIGMAKKAIFLSLSRQIVFLLPCLIILPHFYQLNGIWFSIPIADFISTFIALILLLKHYRVKDK